MAWQKDQGKSAKRAAERAELQANRAEVVIGEAQDILVNTENATVEATEAARLATEKAAYIADKQPSIEKAITDSTEAKGKSTEAKTTADSVKAQFDRVVAEAGSNNPEVVQARGNEVNLNARFEKVTTQLADTVKDLEQREINVKKFAKGDGVTNDTLVVQELINSAPTGAQIYFPSGTYLIDSLNITKSLAIRGQKGTILKSITNGTNFITLSASNINFSDITIDSDNKKARGVFISANSSSVNISRSEIKNIYDNTSNIEVAGIFIQGDTENINIINCHIHHVKSTPNGVQGDNQGASRGISFNMYSNSKPAKNCLIKDCLIEHITPQEDGDGIVVGTSPPSELTFITIEGCTFRECHKRAIKIMGHGVTARNNVIVNDRPAVSSTWEVWGSNQSNIETSGMFSAISIYAGNTTVEGNSIRGGSYYLPIDMQGSPNLLINDVNIRSNIVRPSRSPFRALIMIYNDTGERIIIQNNNMANAIIGIDIRKRFVGGVISGNLIENISERGILFDSFGGYLLFENNSINNNIINANNYGVDLQIGRNFLISGNQLNLAWSGIRQSTAATNISKSGNTGIDSSGQFVPRLTGTLPTPSANIEGLLIRYSSAGNATDILQICIKNGDGTYAWKQVSLI